MNHLMRAIFSICLAIILSCSVHAQDTLRKLVEYDIRIDAVSKMDIPLIQYLVKNAGSKPWIEVLLNKIIAGEILAYDVGGQYSIDKEVIRRHMGGEFNDTMYVIDPITFEETVEIVRRDYWEVNKIVAIRFTEEWTWNEKQKEMQLNHRGIVPIMKVYRADYYFGKKPLFLVKFDN